MSAIFGLIKFNNEPVVKQELLQMQAAMDCVRSDVNNIYCIGSVGFGHMQINYSPESQYEKLPAESPDGNIIFTAYARLDYRNELAKKLNIEERELQTLPDSSLVLEAYLKWQKECVHHLLGDWAFAIYNKRERQLFLARDHGGNTGLYYCSNQDYFCFSMSIQGILSLPWIDKTLDTATIGALIATGRRHNSIQTAFKNIFNIKAAHYLDVAKDTEPIQKQYWDIRNIKPVVYGNEEEYIEHFLSLYQESIRSRIRTTEEVGIMLSSGLDSTSVAALAAPILDIQGKKFYSFTSVPIYHDAFEENYPFQTDESKDVQKIADFIGNIKTTFVDARHYSPLGAMERELKEMGHLVNIANNSYWIQNILDLANDQGIKRMLTGQMGNYTVSWENTGYLYKVLNSGKLKEAYGEIVNWKNYNKLEFKDAFIKLILQPFRQRIKGQLGRMNLGKHEAFFEKTTVNMGILDKINISNEIESLEYTPFTLENDPERLRQSLFVSQISEIGLVYNQYRLTKGIECVDPTQDQKLVEFTFGLPYRLWMSKGTNRYLIRKAMEGKIPKNIVECKYKNPQASDIGVRLTNSTELNRFIALTYKNPNIKKFIDVSKLDYHLKELSSNKSILNKRRNAYHILNALTVALFLQSQEQL